MNHKLDEVNDVIQKLKNELPEQMDTFQKFLVATEKPSVLDAKTKELINIALSICAQCEWCIAVHVKGAFARGANRGEIIDAASMAVLMHGGPALMYMIPLMEALEQFSPNSKVA
jgi:AhpD family alkylhydroperoxidase